MIFDFIAAIVRKILGIEIEQRTDFDIIHRSSVVCFDGSGVSWLHHLRVP